MDRQDRVQSERHGGTLEGVTVIDLTMMLAGPFASMMLADQGANVIKVEPPGGDNTRRIGPHPAGGLTQDKGGYGGYFASINRNKRSIVLDLKSDSGLSALKRMIAQADLLIENYRYGVMERLGLDAETLQALNARLVHVSVRGFGDTAGGISPYRDWPAYDPVSQAMGGIMGITGPQPGGAPTKIGPGIGDIAPAMFAAFGAVAALYRAQRTGFGDRVDISMVDGVLALCERIVYQYSATGKAPGPEGNGHPLLCPFGIFEAADGYLTLGIPNDKFWTIFVGLIGQPDLAVDPEFATNAERLSNASRTNAIVTEWTRGRTRADISAVIGNHVPFAPVMTAADIFSDPHFSSRSMLAHVPFPGAPEGLHVANTPVRMAHAVSGVRDRAPLIGEHADAILAEFGFTADEIQTLGGAAKAGAARSENAH